MDDSEATRIDWQDIAATVLRRRKLVLIVFTSGFALTALLAMLTRPMYTASSRLMLTSERARITVSPDPDSGPTVERVTDQDLNSEVALLQSAALVREVLEPYRGQLEHRRPAGLARRIGSILRAPLALPGWLYRRAHGVAPLSPFERWVRRVAAHLRVRAIRGSNLIEVSLTDANPRWAAEFVNKLSAHHVERHARLSQQSEALGFLESQRQLLNGKMRQAEAALAEFYDREGIDAASAQRAALRDRLLKLEANLADSYTELEESTARAKFLTQNLHSRVHGGSATGRSGNNDPLQLLQTRVVELQLRRSELSSKFAPTSLKIRAVDQQLKEARQLLAAEEGRIRSTGNPSVKFELSQIREKIAAVKARVGALREQIDQYRTKLYHLDRIAPEQERLKQELVTAKESFLTYGKKVEEARFSEALDRSRIVNVSVVEHAAVPTAPRPGKRVITLVLGAIVSLAAGIGLAVLADRTDPTVLSAAAAEKVSGLKVIADIPS
ncbi:MAG: GumC family protein [Candidatus Binatia bacterium]